MGSVENQFEPLYVVLQEIDCSWSKNSRQYKHELLHARVNC